MKLGITALAVAIASALPGRAEASGIINISQAGADVVETGTQNSPTSRSPLLGSASQPIVRLARPHQQPSIRRVLQNVRRPVKLSASVIAAMLALTAISGRAHAAIVINFHEVGSDVVGSASGSADLTDLTLVATTILFAPGEVTPSKGGATVGDPGETHFYKGADGPTSFGTGRQTEASSGSGDFVGVFAVSAFALSPIVLLPQNYVSGAPLSGSSVFDNQSLESLGLDVGQYTYTWGSGADADSLTINVSVPEPSTWALMGLGFMALGLAGYRASKRSAAIA
ncbi:MAG TPA: PEP-CTERM sorting domain-containing protein [Roseiarcus sp.]